MSALFINAELYSSVFALNPIFLTKKNVLGADYSDRKRGRITDGNLCFHICAGRTAEIGRPRIREKFHPKNLREKIF